MKCMWIPRLIVALVSYMPIYVPIIMHDLRLFIVVLLELHCILLYSVHRFFYQFAKFRPSIHFEISELKN